MAIIIEGSEFNPDLRHRIAAFIDAFFEDSDSAEECAFDAEVAVELVGAIPDRSRSFKGRMAAAFGSASRRYGGVCEDAAAVPSAEEDSLGAWLDQVDEPFSTTLLMLIDRKGLSDVDVYKRAHMSRQLFSRIRGDASYRPAKKTVLALALAMELSLDEMRDLLARAGFALSRSSKRDLIVEYFVTNGVYDLFAINEALYEFDQPLI